jgi:hypothetical protein
MSLIRQDRRGSEPVRAHLLTLLVERYKVYDVQPLPRARSVKMLSANHVAQKNRSYQQNKEYFFLILVPCTAEELALFVRMSDMNWFNKEHFTHICQEKVLPRVL